MAGLSEFDATVVAGETTPDQTAATPPTELVAGARLGRYELLFPAGTGGMGQVWAAKLNGGDGFRKLVALKTLRPHEATSGRLRRMLALEAKLAVAVKSPHVVETLDYGDHEGTPYLVMEWVDGASLCDLLDETDVPLQVDFITGIAAQLLDGLRAVHGAQDPAGAPLQMVHCDVSPQNVLLCFSGTARIADFGVATLGSKTAGDKHDLQGKFDFMSPEQITGAGIDARTDIFALSVLVYHLVTGAFPFRGATAEETMLRIAAAYQPVPPRELNPEVSEELQEVILRGLHKDPERRYQSAQQMLDALNQALPAERRGGKERELSELMETVFAEKRRQSRRATARALLSVSATLDGSSTFKGFSVSQTGETGTIPLPPRRSGRRTAKLLLVAALSAAAGTAALAASPFGKRFSRDESRSQAGQPLAQPKPGEQQRETAEPTEVVASGPQPPPHLPEGQATPPTPEPPGSAIVPEPRAPQPTKLVGKPQSRKPKAKPTKLRRPTSATDLKSPY